MSLIPRFLRPSRSLALPSEPMRFGVATADHQCEAYDPQHEDIRDVWERRRGLTKRGIATDFWNRYPEDVKLARDLGCKVFRFSLAWSRLEPSPGQFDDAAFEHYRQVIETIRAAGMEPLMTLHHFTWPVHVEQRGGLIGKDFPEIYTSYVSEVVKRLGPLVHYWLTFNEPTQLIYGYIKPWWEQYYFCPPGLPEHATFADELDAVGKLMRNLFMAHTAARKIIKESNPDAQVGVNPMLLGLPGWLQGFIDWNVTRLRTWDDWVRKGVRFGRRRAYEQGKVDIMLATLSITRDRSEQVDFSESYFVAHQALLIPAESQVRSVMDLDGRPVAVIKYSTSQKMQGRLLPQTGTLSVGSLVEALQALDTGQAAAFLSDDVILHGLMQEYPERYRLLESLPHREHYAAAVAKGHRGLMSVINRAIQNFVEKGHWEASVEKHLTGLSTQPPTEVRMSETLSDINNWQSMRPEDAAQTQQLARRTIIGPRSLTRHIQRRGHIIVAVKEDVPGLGYRDPKTGELHGLEIDLARSIAQDLLGDPNKIIFRPIHTGDHLPLVRSTLRRFDTFFKLYSVLSTTLCSNWWHLGMAGRLPTFLCPKECVDQQDFVGFDYYWGIPSIGLHRFQQLLSAVVGHYSDAPVWPGALYSMLKYYARMFPHKELIIIENGSVVKASGIDRATYLERHVSQVERARRRGIKIPIYICWSITSNREWGLPFGDGNDFGLYHIDLDTDPTLERKCTDSAGIYKRLIAQHSGTVAIPSPTETRNGGTVETPGQHP
ncbi:MAG TPA: family 1 glycosylhydrolase [Ktedonobacteraceae bacterium]|nr:family 1 glycosylhydrolase [Ktedonobacteraceae bacterium]